MSDDSTPIGALAKAINGIPWWAQITLLAAMTFGVPTIMMGVDKLQDIGVLDNPVAKSNDALTLELQKGTKALEELKGVVLQQGATNKEIIKVLEEQNRQKQMRCVMKAKTDDEKKACFPSKRGDD